MSDDTDDPMIAGLLRERAGYAQRGLADRVAQVDEQLALRGHKPPDERETPAGDAQAQARSTPPKGRRGAPKSTT